MKKRFIIAGVLLFALGLWPCLNWLQQRNKRAVVHSNACVNNLRMYRAAKERVASRDGLDIGTPCDTPEMRALVAELLDGPEPLLCQKGGTYTLNPIGFDPTCSLATPGEIGHKLHPR